MFLDFTEVIITSHFENRTEFSPRLNESCNSLFAFQRSQIWASAVHT